MTSLDTDRCYQIICSRDRRFDGRFFTTVLSTGIYCRPSCPARTPKRDNIRFVPTAAAAQQNGFRACKRCRPDASPGSPEWNLRSDTTAQAVRLINDGLLDREGVSGLAQHLGYSERHIARLLTQELGAGPKAISKTRRAQLARTLIETTKLPMTDVAHAAGFGSVRQFNDVIRTVYDQTPTAIRAASPDLPNPSKRRHPTEPKSSIKHSSTKNSERVTLYLPTRSPFAGEHLLAFLGTRAVDGIETWNGQTFRRSLRLPNGHGIVALRYGRDRPNTVTAQLRLANWSDLAIAVQRIRRLLDLDSDPQAVDFDLGRDQKLGPLIERTPGLRMVATVNPFETAVRIVVGQQVSVAGARKVLGKMVTAANTRLTIDDDDLFHVFPDPHQILELNNAAFPMPASRRETIRRLAAAVIDDSVDLSVAAHPENTRTQLLKLKGVGPWTADAICMRALGYPDVFLASDLGIHKAMGRLDIQPEHQTNWMPWRSYATHHLWNSLPTDQTPNPNSDRKLTLQKEP